MQRITQVGVLSLAKVMGLINMIAGTIVAAIYGLMFLLFFVAGIGMGGAQVAPGPAELGIFVAIAIGTIIFVPLISGLMGFVMGALYALILNFVFHFTGGLEVQIRAD